MSDQERLKWQVDFYRVQAERLQAERERLAAVLLSSLQDKLVELYQLSSEMNLHDTPVRMQGDVTITYRVKVEGRLQAVADVLPEDVFYGFDPHDYPQLAHDGIKVLAASQTEISSSKWSPAEEDEDGTQ